MKSFHNIEKSAFRRFEYVGYAGGRVYRIRKTGFGHWEAIQSAGQFGVYDDQLKHGYFRAKGLEGMSRKLEELAALAKSLSDNA